MSHIGDHPFRTVECQMTKILWLTVLLIVFGTVRTPADAIGPSCSKSAGGTTTGDPGNCGGDIYTLGLVSQSTTATTNNYVVSLEDNTSGFMGSVSGTAGYVLAVAPQLNIAGGGTVSSSEATLASAPGGISDWGVIEAGGTDSSGCSTHGNFFCTELLTADQGASAPDKTGSTYTWTFDITLPSGETLDQSSFGDELKVVYNTANSANQFDGVQTSAPITLQSVTPEPDSVFLFGTGLLAIGYIVRKKIRV